MALILERKENQSIRIGENVFVTVHEIVGRKVKLAISAPVSIVIVRCEIDDERDTMDRREAEHLISRAKTEGKAIKEEVEGVTIEIHPTDAPGNVVARLAEAGARKQMPPAGANAPKKESSKGG